MINSRSILKGLFFILAITLMSCNEDASPTPPKAVSLSLPSDGENCNTGTSISTAQSSVEFLWDEASNASSYVLTVTNLQTQAEINRSGITTNSISVDLNKGYAYEWFVTSVSEDFPTDLPESATWRFYLQGDGEPNSAPFPAELISPASGAVITLSDGTYNLSWTGNDPDGDTMTYTLYLDKIDGFQTTTDAYSNLTTTSLDVELEEDNIYYWRIYSEDDNGNSTSSQVRSFRVIE
jgi:hypothetical protein